MEKYHKEPPCLLPHPNHPHLPPCTVLVIAVFGSRVTHTCVLPERSSEPWHGFPSPRVPGCCVPLRTARHTAHCVVLQNVRLVGKIALQLLHASMFHVWMTSADRWQEHAGEFRYSRNEVLAPSLPNLYPSSLRMVITVEASVESDWLDDLITRISWPAVTYNGPVYSLRSCCFSLPNFSQWSIVSAAGWDRRPEQLCRSRRCCGSLSVSLSTM